MLDPHDMIAEFNRISSRAGESGIDENDLRRVEDLIVEYLSVGSLNDMVNGVPLWFHGVMGDNRLTSMLIRFGANPVAKTDTGFDLRTWLSRRSSPDHADNFEVNKREYPDAKSGFKIAKKTDFDRALGGANAKDIQADPRLKHINSMLLSGCSKPLASPKSDINFTDIRVRFPNFNKVIDVIEQSVALCRMAEATKGSSGSEYGGVRLPALLMAGPPGIGKTRFVTEIADCLGIDMFFINCASVTAGFILSGSSTQWGGGSPGKIYQSMVASRVANPIITLDEIDKLAGDARFDGFGPLYPLLEEKTSAHFNDEAIDLPIDCSRVNWVATCNNSSLIPEAILSRLEIIEVEPPHREQMRDVILSIYEDIITDPKNEWGSCFRALPKSVIENLLGDSPRDVKKRIRSAIGRLALDITRNPYPFLATEGVALDIQFFDSGLRSKKKTIGFHGPS